MSTPVEVADRLYARWNAEGLATLADSIDPAVEVITDPLRPDESLRGVDGWERWVQRWEQRYDRVHITVDGLVPMDAEHVLAFVSISATPNGAATQQRWAAAHLWTLREGRIAGWEMHLDLAAAQRTLET